MSVEEFLNQVVVVDLYDGSRHQGILRLAGTNPETGEEFVEVHGGGEVYYVPVVDIATIKTAFLN
ncbi:hypothetical protein ACX1C1_21350 [Paenibacillus sp. strain BS8-2]